jgi:DNA-binding NarL/FixJ family response regulator
MREPLPANFGKPWSKDEEEKVAAAFRAGKSVHEIAREQSRTQSSVRLRLEKLGEIKDGL